MSHLIQIGSLDSFALMTDWGYRERKAMVYSVFPGIVHKVGYDERLGNYVILQHVGIAVSNCHLSKILIIIRFTCTCAQLIHERRVKQINTHYKIKSNEWDESNDIRTSETYLTTLNSFNRFWIDVNIMLEEINS